MCVDCGQFSVLALPYHPQIDCKHSPIKTVVGVSGAKMEGFTLTNIPRYPTTHRL